MLGRQGKGFFALRLRFNINLHFLPSQEIFLNIKSVNFNFHYYFALYIPEERMYLVWVHIINTTTTVASSTSYLHHLRQCWFTKGRRWFRWGFYFLLTWETLKRNLYCIKWRLSTFWNFRSLAWWKVVRILLVYILDVSVNKLNSSSRTHKRNENKRRNREKGDGIDKAREALQTDSNEDSSLIF